MFSSLPWFIKKKIIDYSVSYNNELCILNKEWFNYGAGRFMIVSSQILRKSEHLSYWYSLAENLRLSEYIHIDLNFLKDYRFIKSLYFEFNPELELDFDKYKEVIWAFQLREIYFELGRKNISDSVLSLVMNNVKQLQVLSLKSQYYKLDLDKLFRVDFPKVIYFEIDSEKSSLDFQKIYQHLSQVEQVIIKADDITFGNSSTKKMIFRHLKRLDICFDQKNNFIGSDTFNPFFQFDFPCLVYLMLSANFKYIDLGKLCYNIPNVRELRLNIRFQSENEVIFPNSSLEHLNTFYISCENEEARIISIVINLNYLPRIKYINLMGNLNLSKSNIVSPLTDLIYKNFTMFPHKKISQQMQNVSKLCVSCKFLTNQIETIFLLCDQLEKLYITDISSTINSNFLPLVKFKTNFLYLTGGYFLTDDFITWIHQQLPLSSFSIHYTSEEELCLQPIVFQNLDYLSLYCYNDKSHYYLKTVILKKN